MGENDIGQREQEGKPDPRRERLAALYDAHAAWMYGYAVMLLADTAAAEDAVHQVFAKLARGGAGRVDAPGGYLRAAVRNECYDALRRRQRRAETELTGGAMLVPVADGVGDERRERLESALRALPPEQREVVHLKVYERMTFQDIAAALGVRANTAASRYRYAMDKLRALLTGPAEA